MGFVSPKMSRASLARGRSTGDQRRRPIQLARGRITEPCPLPASRFESPMCAFVWLLSFTITSVEEFTRPV
jgi:hypothetical protein